MSEQPKPSGFTKGPWNADRRHPDYPTCNVIYVSDASGNEIATVYGGGSGPEDLYIAAANSRLIAMAPDLLAENERLRAALKLIADHTTSGNAAAQQCAAVARKALAGKD